jgi:hypothetical protein
MAQPTPQDVHVDAILTNMSIAYMQDEAKYIATKVFPVVPVSKQTNKYFIFDKNAWLRSEAQRRAPATESAGGSYTLSTDTYSCDVFAFHTDIADQVRNNSDNPLAPDRNATNFVTQQMLLKQELVFVTDFMGTGIWGTDKVGTTDFVKWSDQTASDPIGDIETGKQQILSTTGFEANTLVLGYQVYRYLKRHPDLIDLVKYTSGRNLTVENLAAIFEVDRVFVAKAVKATNKEGATGAYGFIHGANALLCYAAPNPGLEVPSAGYTFAWDGVSGDIGAPVGVARYRMDLKKADRIEAESAWDNKVTGTDLGYFYSAAA